MKFKRQPEITIHAIRNKGNFVFLCDMFAIVDMEDSAEICFFTKKIPVYQIADYVSEYDDHCVFEYSSNIGSWLLKLLHDDKNRLAWLSKFERVKDFSFKTSEHTTGVFGFFTTPHHEIRKMNIAFEKIKQTITFILDAYHQEYD